MLKRARSASPVRRRRGSAGGRHMLVTRSRRNQASSSSANESTFWPVLSDMRNATVIADLPWRWFREGNVVHVRGSVKVKFDSNEHTTGVGAFDIEALPLRAARFDGYRNMEALFTGFIRNSARNYPMYGVPHGNKRSVRCYFDIDDALLNSESHQAIAMIGGTYDI